MLEEFGGVPWAGLKDRVYEWGIIPTTNITFSEAVVNACKVNVCGNYNRSWSCPPACGTMEEQKRRILAYKKALVFTTKYNLEDSFDFEGMTKAKELHDELTREIHRQFGGTYPVFGAGGCLVCETCAYPDPCRYLEMLYSSIEAAGINVTELSVAAKVKYNNGANTVTYFSMLLFNDDE